MPSLRKNAFTRTVTNLNTLKTGGTLKEVSKDPKDLEQFNRFPACYIQMLPDIERSMEGIPGNDEHLVASLAIVLFGKIDDETLVEDLEDVIDSVITQIKGDIANYRALDPAVYITRIQVVEGPLIDTQRERSFAEIEVEFQC